MASVLVDRPSGSISRHFAYLTMRVPDAWTSFWLVLGLAATGLIAETSGAKPAVICYLALTGLALLIFPHFAVKANARNALLWGFPVWMLFSVAWSAEPQDSLHSVALVFATLAGTCLVGSVPHRRAVNSGLAVALGMFIIYSAIAGRIWQFGSDDMFAGVIARKNQFGHLAALEIMIVLSMLSWAGERERGPILTLMVPALLFGLASLLASRATGSLLSTLIAVSCFSALVAYRRVSLPLKVTLVAALGAAIVIYLLFGEAIEQQVFSTILVTFNKDVTLTGRTELWAIADRLIAKHPFIGHGPGSFWSVNNPDAWTVWREMRVQPNSGFTFHNTFRDILVDFGWIGLGLFLLGIGWHFVRELLIALASGDVIDASRVATLIYFLIRTPVETITYGALTMDIIPLIGFLCIPVTTRTRWRKLIPIGSLERTAPRIERLPTTVRERPPVRTASPPAGFRTE